MPAWLLRIKPRSTTTRLWLLYRRALEERPHAVWIYRYLTSALSDAGRMTEAKEAFAEMMRHYPGLTVAKFRQAMPRVPTLDRDGLTGTQEARPARLMETLAGIGSVRAPTR